MSTIGTPNVSVGPKLYMYVDIIAVLVGQDSGRSLLTGGHYSEMVV